MGFPDRLKLPVAFDPALLAADLATLGAVTWTPHFVEQNYEGDWSVIALRAPEGTASQHPIRQIYSDPSITEFEDTPLMEACRHMRAAANAFGAPHAVRLMRLTPGSVIKEHRDHDLAAEAGMARIHVAVATNAGVVFELNRRRVDIGAGQAWYLRLADPHRVANLGAADRVHLVIDVPFNATLEALMRQAMADAAAD
jgi:hypothetical protein